MTAIHPEDPSLVKCIMLMVAQMLGMSQTGYSIYETDENDIPTAILIKLADFYQTSTDYLLGRTDKK